MLCARFSASRFKLQSEVHLALFWETYIYIWYFDPNINLFACFWVQSAILLSYCGQRLRPCGLLEGFKRSFMSRTAFCRKRNEILQVTHSKCFMMKKALRGHSIQQAIMRCMFMNNSSCNLVHTCTSELMFHPPFLKWKHVFLRQVLTHWWTWRILLAHFDHFLLSCKTLETTGYKMSTV